jgi:hypothetical protein
VRLLEYSVVCLLVFVGSLSYPVWSTVLALVNYWLMKREDIDSDILKPHSSLRTRKLLLMKVMSIPLAVYGLYTQTIRGLGFEWVTPTPLTENIASLQIVLVAVRSDVDTAWKTTATGATRTAIFTSLLTLYVFAGFGLEAEARKAYGEALLKLGRFIGVTLREHWPRLSTLPFSWSVMALWKASLQQRLANALSLVQPNAPQIAPYVSTAAPDDDTHVPASPTRTQPSNPVGNRIDFKRQRRMPLRGPARRHSIHKPPLAALNSVNVIPSAPDVPLRRLSLHKSPLVPLAPPNAPATATPGASGSTPPHIATANTRRQEKFAPRPRSRRLSYHKPAFVPLAPANASSAIANTLEPIIPLAEIPRDIIGERNAVLQPESVIEDTEAPPPLSSVSPSTTAPTLSTPSTATPAPPYQELNPSLERAS